MSSAERPNRVRENVHQAKEWLAEGRQKILQQHQAGSPGIQVCSRLSDLLDTVVLDVFEAALKAYGDESAKLYSKIALIPTGGYGRREMAPYSDVDLMLLYAQGSLPLISQLAKRIVQDLSDVGLDLGFSVRTIRQAKQMAARDAVIFTSLVDSRFLGGSVRLYSKFRRNFARMTRRRSHALVSMIHQARNEERKKYGETVYLLEPNVKRSSGGLRDLQFVRWVGFARHGHQEPSVLVSAGNLSQQDYRSLRKAQSFLLRLRNELHFHAKSASDVLYRGDQVRLAELEGYRDDPAMLAVEKFMQDYFNHTSTTCLVAGHFVDGARWKYPRLRNIASALVAHRVSENFLVGPVHLSATREGMKVVTTSIAEILRMMDLTCRYDCRIDHPTWTAIRSAMMAQPDLEVDQEAAERFLAFLSQPNQVGRLLRRLHELRVLGKLVPGFEHVRCLLQFNEYHKYTVDEHSFRAVERATEFAYLDNALGKAYRDIKDKWLLHLALIIHDMGKGFPEDHSEVGARLSEKVASQLFLDKSDAEKLRFLVHKHLMLSHLAFRRDTSDERVINQHAAEIGSPSVMRMLFVLTCADLAAVGPDVLNHWKLDVLTQLYLRMMDRLLGGDDGATNKRIMARRMQLIEEAANTDAAVWYHEMVTSLPPAYLQGPGSETILDDLARIQPLNPHKVAAWSRYLPDPEVMEYSVGGCEQIADGIFHRLTGALSAKGLEILSAEIHSLANGLFLDRFYVRDGDYNGQPPEQRCKSVSLALEESLITDGQQQTYRRTWQDRKTQEKSLTNLPPRVRIDNSTSDTHTIIDVFTHDRPGLLAKVARQLYELDLSVSRARIGTYLDQVVDVFYVTDLAGERIETPERIEHVREALLQAIEATEPTST